MTGVGGLPAGLQWPVPGRGSCLPHFPAHSARFLPLLSPDQASAMRVLGLQHFWAAFSDCCEFSFSFDGHCHKQRFQKLTTQHMKTQCCPSPNVIVMCRFNLLKSFRFLLQRKLSGWGINPILNHEKNKWQHNEPRKKENDVLLHSHENFGPLQDTVKEMRWPATEWETICARQTIQLRNGLKSFYKYFTKECIRMDSKSAKRCSAFVMREMLSNTTMKYQYIPTGMTRMKKTDNANYR